MAHNGHTARSQQGIGLGFEYTTSLIYSAWEAFKVGETNGLSHNSLTLRRLEQLM